MLIHWTKSERAWGWIGAENTSVISLEMVKTSNNLHHWCDAQELFPEWTNRVLKYISGPEPLPFSSSITSLHSVQTSFRLFCRFWPLPHQHRRPFWVMSGRNFQTALFLSMFPSLQSLQAVKALLLLEHKNVWVFKSENPSLLSAVSEKLWMAVLWNNNQNVLASHWSIQALSSNWDIPVAWWTE